MPSQFLAGMDLTPTASPNPFGAAGGSGGGERLGLGGEALNNALGGMEAAGEGAMVGVNDGRS
jgi:hypothetical protein